MEEEDYKTRLENFVYDSKKRFVDPAKVEAVEQYGLDKALELWKDGEPSWEIRNKLNKIAAVKALYFRKDLGKARLRQEIFMNI